MCQTNTFCAKIACEWSRCSFQTRSNDLAIDAMSIFIARTTEMIVHVIVINGATNW